jgi:hypothetical protein
VCSDAELWIAEEQSFPPLPANPEVKRAMENRTYKGYDARHFARLTVGIINVLDTSPDGPKSRVKIDAYATDDRLPNALRSVPLRVKITSNDEKARLLPYALPWEMEVTQPNLSVLIANVLIERLSHIDLLLTLSTADSNLTLATMPLKLLMPVKVQ